MARYATTEEKFECRSCHIECTQREMIQEMPLNRHVLSCPNCDVEILSMVDGKIFGLYGYIPQDENDYGYVFNAITIRNDG